jgi:hypothetical protein
MMHPQSLTHRKERGVFPVSQQYSRSLDPARWLRSRAAQARRLSGSAGVNPKRARRSRGRAAVSTRRARWTIGVAASRETFPVPPV